jgi:hypothetical protein
MNLIFFGAGASYGSDGVGTPPLSSHLFPRLAAFDRSGWGSLIAPWSDKFLQDFEQAMSDYINRGLFAAPLQWAMAEYFFKQFPISPSNLYIKLLSDITLHMPDFCLATINYDTLLFQAANFLNLPVNLGSISHPKDRLPVCLPHGSSVIYCEGVRATGGVSFTGGISTGGTAKVFRDGQHFDTERSTNVFPPVMSYFEPSKFTVSCSNFIVQERKTFASWVDSSARIAIIGVNVHPIDKHIWDPLSTTKAHILYISGNGGANRFSTWASQNARSGDVVSPDYFANSYGQLKSFFGL